MDKILFIVPPTIMYADFAKPDYNVRTSKKKNGIFTSVSTDMPLGIMSMSSYIKKHVQVETRLLDFNIVLNKLESFDYNSFIDLFRESIATLEYQPTIIGISSLFTSSYQSLLDIAQCCRNTFADAIIVGGGGVPTNIYRQIFEDSTSFDALCYGEGEKPLLRLLKADNKPQYLKESKSWITKDKAMNGESFEYDFIENLDEIPFCDYDILNTDEYCMNPTTTTYAGLDNREKSFHVMTSRGCPHHCCFCASHTVHGRKVRFYSIDRVKEDFIRLKNKYGAETFVFQDDHLMADKQRVLVILDIIKQLQLSAIFVNGLALYTLDRQIIEAFKSAGVNLLVLAVESGSNRVLKEIIHKPLNLDIVKRVADDCRALDIYSDVNILIGFPGETKEDIEDARRFLKTINANWFRVVIATPLVGSEMLDICIQKNYLKHGFIDCNYKKAIVETEVFTTEWIQEKAYLLNLELNFVENSDFRSGHYRTALKGFENAIKAKSDHALAYYYASKCYRNLGESEKAREYMDIARRIIDEDPTWSAYASMFNVVVEERDKY
jgi:anaerobic magnesium-protoporphyrin IX monomethyl ester cyclase